MSKQIAIFGAGDFGRQALEFYGAERVSYFIDNNPARAGEVYCGKKILSFAQFMELSDRPFVIVAMRHTEAVVAQLEGIRGEHICFRPEYKLLLERLRTKEPAWKNAENITFFGVETMTTEMLVQFVRQAGATGCLRVMEYDGAESIGQRAGGCMVEPFRESEGFPHGVIILSSGENFFEREVVAEHFARHRATVINPFQPVRNFDAEDLVYNQYAAMHQTEELTEAAWLKGVANDPNKDVVFRLVDVLQKYQPLFHHVEIETINRCNGKCTFCPVSAGHDTREKKIMTEELFRKIIDDLKSLDYDGRLSLFSNGEPLLDPDIVERHAYARAQLPKAYMRLYTNGTLLSVDKFWGLMASLDEMIIDNYNQALELNPTSKIIAEGWKAHPIPGKKVQIWLRKEDEILTTRGGDAPNRTEKIEMTTERCTLPFRQLIIRPDGKVSLCCNDPLGKMTLGDLSKQSLEEVWYGEAFRDVREKLRKGRGFLEHCRFCDTYYTG